MRTSFSLFEEGEGFNYNPDSLSLAQAFKQTGVDHMLKGTLNYETEDEGTNLLRMGKSMTTHLHKSKQGWQCFAAGYILGKVPQSLAHSNASILSQSNRNTKEIEEKAQFVCLDEKMQ